MRYPREGFWQEFNIDKNQKEVEIKRAVWSHTILGHGCKKFRKYVRKDECSSLNDGIWHLNHTEQLEASRKW